MLGDVWKGPKVKGTAGSSSFLRRVLDQLLTLSLIIIQDLASFLSVSLPLKSINYSGTSSLTQDFKGVYNSIIMDLTI